MVYQYQDFLETEEFPIAAEGVQSAAQCIISLEDLLSLEQDLLFICRTPTCKQLKHYFL